MCGDLNGTSALLSFSIIVETTLIVFSKKKPPMNYRNEVSLYEEIELKI